MNEIATQLVRLIGTSNKLQARYLESVIELLDLEEQSAFESYISYCNSQGISVEQLANAYNLFVTETLREQLHFKRHKTYRYSSYQEVGTAVYSNHEYMHKYMLGLALSRFLWAQHIQIGRFFSDTIPKNSNGHFLEVGPGHGFYFMTAMKQCNFSFFEGIDISNTSVEMTRNILQSGSFGNFSNYQIHEGDFLDIPSEKKYSAIVMSEVLEHVERPDQFLKKAHELSAPDTYIYLSTCINAPEIDHIYLFREIAEIESLIEEQSFIISDKLVMPYHGRSLAESEQDALPINIAMVLKTR